MVLKKIDTWAGPSIVNQTMWAFVQLSAMEFVTGSSDYESGHLATIEFAVQYGFI